MILRKTLLNQFILHEQIISLRFDYVIIASNFATKKINSIFEHVFDHLKKSYDFFFDRFLIQFEIEKLLENMQADFDRTINEINHQTFEQVRVIEKLIFVQNSK